MRGHSLKAVCALDAEVWRRAVAARPAACRWPWLRGALVNKGIRGLDKYAEVKILGTEPQFLRMVVRSHVAGPHTGQSGASDLPHPPARRGV